MNRTPCRVLLASMTALSISAGHAIAQNKIPKDDPKNKDQSTQKQPARPAAPAAKKELIFPGPYIAWDSPKDWTLRTKVRVSSKSPGTDAQILALPPGKQRDENAVSTGNAAGFTFQTLTMLLPAAPQTAGAVPADELIDGWLKVDDREVASSARLSQKSPGSTRYVQFTTRTGSNPSDVPDGFARAIEMQIEVPMTCYRTKFDERAALDVDWPKEDWPAEAKATFKPQVYVETYYDGTPYNQAKLKELIKQWTNDDPRSVKPVMLAKALAAEIVRNFQPTGDSRSVLRTGELQGFQLDGLDRVMETGRGTEFDLVCLLTAVYRAAGLPARLVVGVEAENVDSKDFLVKRGGKGHLRSWVEFALFDELNYSLNWVPVDIVRIRKQSSRPQPLDRTWKYFGNHDDLNLITPITLHFHPPTTVIAYSVPGFWGWMVTPNPPATAYQALFFDAYRSAKRPVDPNKKDDDKKKGPYDKK